MAHYGFVEPVSEGIAPSSALLSPIARSEARAELDAVVAARVFSLTRAQLSDLLDTFAVLRRREEKASKEFRTKRANT